VPQTLFAEGSPDRFSQFFVYFQALLCWKMNSGAAGETRRTMSGRSLGFW
jgi:hypothetical protein